MATATTYFFARESELQIDVAGPGARERITALGERKEPFRRNGLASGEFARILQIVGIGNGTPTNEPLISNESFVLERFDARAVRRFRNVPASEIHAVLAEGDGVALWHWIVGAYEDGAELYLLTEI